MSSSLQSTKLRRAAVVLVAALAPLAAAIPLHAGPTSAGASTRTSAGAGGGASVVASTSVDPVSSTPLTVSEEHPPTIASAARAVDGFHGAWLEIDRGSLDLRIALDEVERAEAATRIARGFALPSASHVTTASYTPTATVSGGLGTPAVSGPSPDLLQSTLSLVAPLIAFRAWHAIGTSKVSEEIARLSITDLRRRLALGVARAVVAIASAEKQAELNRIGLEASLDRLGLTRKRLAAGVGDARDRVRALQDVATARATIAPGDEQVAQAREALGQLLGLPVSAGVGADPVAIEREVMTFCGAATDATAPRIDLKIAQTQVELAERNVDDILLKFAPTLTAQLQAGVVGSPIFSTQYRSLWSISATLTIPLYDGGVRYGEKRDRVALVDEARAKQTQTEIAIAIEQAQTRRAITVAVDAQSSAREARDLAAEADRLARVAYANGVGTNFDLIDAAKTLRLADAVLLARDLDVTRARVALPFVAGHCVGLDAR